MSESSRHDLEATLGERKKLRAAKIRIKEIHHHSIRDLCKLLQVSKIRAMELSALSEFQSIPSVGISFALDLVSMGYYSLKQLKGKDGAKLVDQFEVQRGVWADPCVEDQFRLVVHFAEHPDSTRSWWDFTAQRKAFRARYGYPATRPTKPWFELPQYRRGNRLDAKKPDTKDDLSRKLGKAVTLMKRDFSKPLTLRELADSSNLSMYHFLRCFRSAYSKTPMQYLTEIRLKNACRILKKTKMPISSVVTGCGFQNDSSFARLFRRQFKQSPASYRRAHALTKVIPAS